MAYTTNYTRSTAKHRISNVYMLNYTLASKNGKKKTINTKLIVPWAIYSSCSSCQGKYRLSNSLFGCIGMQANKMFGEENADWENCKINKCELIDRVDETDAILKKYNEFACEKVFNV